MPRTAAMGRWRPAWLALACAALAVLCLGAACGSVQAADHGGDVLRIGSKRFTESYILGEVLAQTAAPYTRTEHRRGLGNTAIVLAALRTGEIDVYPEYTGTIALEILRHTEAPPLATLQRELAALGLGVAVPLGFNNTYALAVRGDVADVRAVGDLAVPAHRADRFGLSHEFIGRADGWPGLARRYGLQQQPQGLDHGLAYDALRQRQVDVIDIYSTDARIRQYGLKVLEDDRAYFPRYDAVLLYRLDSVARFPAAWQALRKLEGRISTDDMIAMNAAAELGGKAFAAVARAWLATPGTENSAKNATGAQPSLWSRIVADDFGRLTRQHVTLVVVAVALACLLGIPLGIVAAAAPRLRQTVLALAGVLQTVPSLALLAMLIPLLGTIGAVPALVALVAYALLPIVRNTCTGLGEVPPGLTLAAQALGLRRWQRLRYVELPLAMPVVLAGIKTAAVISVGTATIAAFIGAGGYGERITTGLALNDQQLLLAGALPAAALALLTQGLFEVLELVRKMPGR